MRSLALMACLSVALGLAATDAQGDEKSTGAAASAVTTVWAGNHFEEQGLTWTWEDSPTDLCGRARKWEYTAQSGDQHGIIPHLQCSGDYPIHWMKIQGTPHEVHAGK